jgi:GTP-binding protein
MRASASATDFLGHIERCRVLLHLVDVTGENAGADYRTIRRELAAYGGGLVEKKEIVALSKIDAVDEETLKKQRERLKRAMRSDGPAIDAGAKRAAPLELSAVAGRGMKEALRALADAVYAGRAAVAAEQAPAEEWAP